MSMCDKCEYILTVIVTSIVLTHSVSIDDWRSIDACIVLCEYCEHYELLWVLWVLCVYEYVWQCEFTHITYSHTNCQWHTNIVLILTSSVSKTLFENLIRFRKNFLNDLIEINVIFVRFNWVHHIKISFLVQISINLWNLIESQKLQWNLIDNGILPNSDLRSDMSSDSSKT